MCDLSLDTIIQAHAEDQEAYKYNNTSPQHLHRHWLLKFIEKRSYSDEFQDISALHEEFKQEIAKLKQQLSEAHDVMNTLSSVVDGYYVKPGHALISEHEEYNVRWGIEDE
jgi:hypothetical protein